MLKRSKYYMPAPQAFAFGGIANPTQRAVLRGSDTAYLSQRQKELDAFEAQRLLASKAASPSGVVLSEPTAAGAGAAKSGGGCCGSS